MIRLAIRVDSARAEVVLAELLELAPGGVEEVQVSPCVVEYAVYGAPGELPRVPDLNAAVGASLVEISTSEVPGDCIPKPRKLIAASAVIAPPNCKIASTTSALTIFGNV